MTKSQILILVLVIVLAVVGVWALAGRLHLGGRAPQVPIVQLDSTLHPARGPRPIDFDYIEAPFDTVATIKLSDSLPPWAFHISLTSDSTHRYGPTYCALKVIQVPDSVMLQKFVDTLDLPGYTRLRFIDVDFDGLLDLEILSAQQGGRHFWLLDRKSRQFHFSSEFSEYLGGDFVVDPDKRELGTGFRSVTGAESLTYRIAAGHLLLIERKGFEEVVINDTAKTRDFLERLVDGKMKLVAESFQVR